MEYEDLPKIYDSHLTGGSVSVRCYTIKNNNYDFLLIKYKMKLVVSKLGLSHPETKSIEMALGLESQSVFQNYTEDKCTPVTMILLGEHHSPCDDSILISAKYLLDELQAKRPDIYAEHYRSNREFNVKACVASQRYNLHTAKFTDKGEIYATWVKKPACN